ncbi:phosphatidylglycerophosphate phosphatase PTPMT2-like [Hordeum vulgare subsp. vulgare]|uniref:phosphatidylglycerophosphate phosphatase PTPMT2-like n=1 Tax=Hordeum vulgare subsp. vulgare TaxID=112509 RepID=UPI001D1A52C0|nr:phosphatidylglycerophosphate phosphatase PTPMT2-like [Hordeum vulgare subsp. vulgare]
MAAVARRGVEGRLATAVVRRCGVGRWATATAAWRGRRISGRTTNGRTRGGTRSCGEGRMTAAAARCRLVGVGARLALYPSLAYNVARNKMEADFHWWDQVDEHVWLGAVPFQRHVPRLKALGVRGVVTLNEPFETFVTSKAYQDYDIENLQIPTRDYACAPSLENICKDLKFINRIALQGNSTYVHCKAGRGRSTTVVLRYLIKYKGMDPKQAWVHTKSIRPRICLTSAQQKAVTLFSTINPVGGDIPSQSSAGVVAHHRPNTRQIQPDPEDHLEL